jgi:hypothetical protein
VVRWPHCKKLQSRLPGRFYRRVARRELDDDVCRDLARHIKGFADRGIADSNMLTVHGLSYLNRREAQRRKPRR